MLEMATILQINPLDSRVPVRAWATVLSRRGGAILLGLTVLWFARCALAGEEPPATGSVEGTALVASPHGQAYVAGAKVVVSGPIRMETETNGNGSYTFIGMIPGIYTIAATFSGLQAVRTIAVTPHQVVQVAARTEADAGQYLRDGNGKRGGHTKPYSNGNHHRENAARCA